MAIDVTVTDEKMSGFSEFLTMRIKEFNNEISPYHKSSREPGAVHPLNIIVKEGEAIIGGLCGSIYGGWLEIDKFFIPYESRGKGLGSDLLRKAEAEAVRQGCHSSFLTTYSFQAKGFYEGFGYYVTGELKDYPPGEVFYWMRKDFSPISEAVTVQ